MYCENVSVSCGDYSISTAKRPLGVTRRQRHNSAHHVYYNGIKCSLHLPGLCSKLSDTTVLTRTPMCRQRETSIFAEAVLRDASLGVHCRH